MIRASGAKYDGLRLVELNFGGGVLRCGLALTINEGKETAGRFDWVIPVSKPDIREALENLAEAIERGAAEVIFDNVEDSIREPDEDFIPNNNDKKFGVYTLVEEPAPDTDEGGEED